jgi:hypothetical protein
VPFPEEGHREGHKKTVDLGIRRLTRRGNSWLPAALAAAPMALHLLMIYGGKGAKALVLQGVAALRTKCELADGEGFEPPVPLRARQFSRLEP